MCVCFKFQLDIKKRTGLQIGLLSVDSDLSWICLRGLACYSASYEENDHSSARPCCCSDSGTWPGYCRSSIYPEDQAQAQVSGRYSKGVPRLAFPHN